MYSLTEQDVAIMWDIYCERPDITQKEFKEEFNKRRYKDIYIMCVAKKQQYENAYNVPARYIFMSQNTFNALKSHIYANKLFDLAREIGSAVTYFMGCKVCVADIGDDEVFVVGEN